MKKLVKIISICIILILGVIINSKNWAVGETFKTELKSSTELLELGEEFQISVNFSEIKTQEGFTNIRGIIYFDEDTIEYVPNKEEFIDNNTSNNMQSIIVNRTENGNCKFDVQYLDGKKINNFKLTFKTKADTDSLNTKIRLEILEAKNVDNANISGVSNDAELTLILDQNVEYEILQEINDDYELSQDETEEIVQEGITPEAITKDDNMLFSNKKVLIIGISIVLTLTIIAVIIIIIKNKSKR